MHIIHFQNAFSILKLPWWSRS